jgi:hypothetical protein
VGHITSEISRARSWAARKDDLHVQSAILRALELLEISLDNVSIASWQRELTLLKEILIYLQANPADCQDSLADIEKALEPFLFLSAMRKG